jgi:hypothetical protein
MSKEMSYQGRLVSVVERKGGWTTILDGMKTVKVRNSELSAPVGGKANVPAKPGPVRSAKDRQPKPEKAKREPKAAKAESDRLVNPDLARYVTSDVKTASGRKAIDVNDGVAAKLRGLDLADTYRAASEATGESMAGLKRKYEHLNPGMQRMNLGNLIRGAASKAAREAEKAKAAKAK